MTPAERAKVETGLLGPVPFYTTVSLLALSPLLRGGNRYAALLPLELIALVTIPGLLATWRKTPAHGWSTWGMLALIVSPAVLALVQLLPVIPTGPWLALPGHEAYALVVSLFDGAPAWRSLSVAPQATAGALLAGVPLAVALTAGYLCTIDELRKLLRVVTVVALFECALGLLQLAAGEGFLLFGTSSAPPIGTFANRNHFGNYLAMTLCMWVWVAWGIRGDTAPAASKLAHRLSRSDAVGIVIAAVLLMGIVSSRSRGAIATGIPGAIASLALTRIVRRDSAVQWRWIPPAAFVGIALLAWVLGADTINSRFEAGDVGTSVNYRAELARASIQGALAFWPFGSGWGTYEMVFPRFQSPGIAGLANHAHMDYVEFLFEGGAFFLLLAALFLLLATRRIRVLAHAISHGTRASRDTVAASFCGVALLVLVLHSVMDFPMRIPANAMLGCLLAGAFLRPLNRIPRHP